MVLQAAHSELTCIIIIPYLYIIPVVLCILPRIAIS